MSTNFEQPLQWIDFDDTPIMFANQFLVQEQPHELVISIGQVTGPPAVAPPDQVGAADHVYPGPVRQDVVDLAQHGVGPG